MKKFVNLKSFSIIMIIFIIIDAIEYYFDLYYMYKEPTNYANYESFFELLYMGIYLNLFLLLIIFNYRSLEERKNKLLRSVMVGILGIAIFCLTYFLTYWLTNWFGSYEMLYMGIYLVLF